MGTLTHFELSSVGRVLLMLRAGPLCTEQIAERYGERCSWVAEGIRNAFKLDYITKTHTDSNAYRYELTAEGRARCPTHRQVCSMNYLETMRDMASDAEVAVQMGTQA
jgi:hypothetical protein